MVTSRLSNKRMCCRYGDTAALCRYYAEDGECMNHYACLAFSKNTPGFFGSLAAKCRGFRDRTPSPMAAQRDYLWDNCGTMAKAIYQDRAETRKTLTNNPELICEDCPEFLLPLSFRERSKPGETER